MIIRYRLVNPALPLQHVTQIEVRVGEIRLDRQRPAVTASRLVQFVLRLQRQPQVVVRKGLLRILPQRLTDQLDCLCTVSHLVGDNAQQVQRIKVRRLRSQYLPIDSCRLAQPPGFMLRKRLLDEVMRR